MRKIVTAATLAVGLALAATAPAQALYVRPSQAPLLSASGEDSTCVVTTKAPRTSSTASDGSSTRARWSARSPG